ncbi:MAG: hypothetical protein J7J22_04270 [Candidatus Verstraetearchaeota archaeon]|nr:hypothetical protein [Candidatus Verstraetearchaeota archaeon]
MKRNTNGRIDMITPISAKLTFLSNKTSGMAIPKPPETKLVKKDVSSTLHIINHQDKN